MYRPFFQLSDLPFKSTPDLHFFYQDAEREDIVNALLYTLERGDGIIKVVGEVGSGKTTLLRRLSQRLPQHYVSVYINSPNLSSHDILFFICVEFGLQVEREEQKFFLTKKLNTFLLEQHASGKRPLLLIDEAQAMSIDTLEEIRLLTNLETEQDKLLQMVLFGQPELDTNLSQAQIRQFQTRITHAIYLQPFCVNDIQSYLNFRMRKAGYAGADLFTPKIAALIHQMSRGLLREVNTLADRALLAAYSESSRVLKPHHLDPSLKPRFGWLTGLLIGLLFVLMLSAVGFYLYKQGYLAQNMLDDEVVKSLPQPSVSVSEVPTTPASSHDSLPVALEPAPAQSKDSAELGPSVEVPVAVSDELPEQVAQPVLQTRESSRERLYQHLQTQTFLYTVQLIVVPIAEFDTVYQRILTTKMIDPHEVQYYADEVNGVYKFYYGRFDGMQSAQAFIARLPTWLQFGRPYIQPRMRLLKELAVEAQPAQEYEKGIM
ncbi:MAG: ExeA family protein [Thiomicrospira sp.]